MLLFMSFDYARLVLCSEAWFADRPEIILKDPISDTMTLSPGDAVGVAIVNADVHARVNDVLLGLGEARESARLLQSIRISRGHLKVEGIRAEEKPQHVSNRAGSGGMTRRVFREIGGVNEWLPVRIRFNVRLGVEIGRLAAQANSGDWAPEIVEILAFPAGDLSVGKGGLNQRIHTR